MRAVERRKNKNQIGKEYKGGGKTITCDVEGSA